MRSVRPLRHPRLKEAAAALADNRPHSAEQLLSKFLAKHPGDLDAICLVAETALRLGRFEDAAALLAPCFERSPDFHAARFVYAKALHQQNESRAAAAQLDVLLQRDPQNILYRDLQSVVLTATGRHAEALTCYRRLVEDYPESGELRVRFGHALRTVGLREESIAAYRSVIATSPARGDAYWSLASLRVCFAGAELDAMQSLLARSDLSSDNRVYLHFALGMAFGDLALWEKSFEHYAKANAIRRIGVVYDPDGATSRASAIRTLFTPSVFRERNGSGCNSPEPIFVVGMQRSGSTLVEQILASHSAVEGAGELSDVPRLAQHLENRATPQSGNGETYDMPRAEKWRSLGEHYLDSTRWRRSRGRPFFVDKQPFNFWHVGLIHLMLPKARIVDVRRHPVACCFSNFTTLLGHGQGFNYRLSDLGRYYRDYVDAMEHFDRVLPGKIHRVYYERVIAEPETEIRRLLEYLELPFEEGCLRFHDNNRAFDSASNEQVRTPIFTDSVGRWRNYEPWLGQLKEALGPALESWNDALSFEF